MRHLKTILKWALPSAKFTYKMLAVSAEVFCRHCFGRRYAPTLLLSLCFSFLGLNLIRITEPQAHPGLIDDYLLIYLILVIYHVARMWWHQTPVHSYSNGLSWEIWSRFNFSPNLVKTWIEPLMLAMAGILLLWANQHLAFWLIFGAGCLFAKESLSRRRFNNRVMDALDARLEGERIATATRQQSEPQRGRGQDANSVVMAEPVQPPVNFNTVPQMYSELDPELQRLVRASNENQPQNPAANRPGTPLVVVRNQRRAPGQNPVSAPTQQGGIQRGQRIVVYPETRPTNHLPDKPQQTKTNKPT